VTVAAGVSLGGSLAAPSAKQRKCGKNGEDCIAGSVTCATASGVKYPGDLKVRPAICVTKEVKAIIRESRSVPVLISQLTPPAKVPSSPSMHSPATPEGFSFFYEDIYYSTTIGGNDIVYQPTIFGHIESPSVKINKEEEQEEEANHNRWNYPNLNFDQPTFLEQTNTRIDISTTVIPTPGIPTSLRSSNTIAQDDLLLSPLVDLDSISMDTETMDFLHLSWQWQQELYNLELGRLTESDLTSLDCCTRVFPKLEGNGFAPQHTPKVVSSQGGNGFPGFATQHTTNLVPSLGGNVSAPQHTTAKSTLSIAFCPAQININNTDNNFNYEFSKEFSPSKSLCIDGFEYTTPEVKDLLANVWFESVMTSLIGDNN